MSVGLQQVRDELGTEDTTNYIFKRFSEKFNLSQGPTIRQTRDVGDDTIWGQFTWGEAEWDGSYGSLFILGSSTYGVLGQNTLGDELGELVIELVRNPNQMFIDKYDITFFTDSTNTTADDSVQGEINFTSGEIYQSEEIYKGGISMSKAKLNVTIDSGSFDLYMWTDDNTPEVVSNDVQHTFATGGTSIKYKIVENAASTGKITNINIQYL